MPYKELKEPNEQPRCAELVTTLMVVAMVCGTLLLTTQMWIQERQTEIEYLRGD